ncbi:MAG TPA: N-methyl-L-tryptophan oxidase [Pyrinomonadaceae bacterium]|nr:N-methyl-L-tryptophan oxidase [Pyrinomonadaceae bacterium]HMP65869.1 N-methyl-L-tryptophan oxidase [Pyrinomonadaceae bacterium]
MNADVIVIGLGAMGSAACYQLAKRGANVIGIDRYSPPHSLGSTHGETRITRQAIGEGEHFVPFALRSYEIWRELEQETGADLLTITGGLIVTSDSTHLLHGNRDFLQTTIDAAARFRIAHRILDANEIAREFPQLTLEGNERGYFEDAAGFLRPGDCVTAQLGQAQKLGAVVRRNERVVRVRQEGSGVQVVTESRVYSAAKAIISAGPWVNEFLESVPADLFKVYRQVLFWFDVSSAYDQYVVGRFPVFIWSFGRWRDDYVYGFPAIDGKDGGLKLASEDFRSTTSPDEAKREVSKEEAAARHESYVSGKLKGIAERCIRSVVCLYTVTPNSNFVIDQLDENVILASPCSGHGFKHSAALGETLAELVTTGSSSRDISKFSFHQFH